MKKSILILLAIILLLTSISCEKGLPKGSVDSTVPLPSWQTDEEKTIAEAWQKQVENILQADQITKVEMDLNGIDYVKPFISKDSSLIKRWEILTSKLRCVVVPYDGRNIPVGQPGVALTFYNGSKQLPLFYDCPLPNALTTEECKLGTLTAKMMLQIENYNDVKDEFNAILTDMGVQLWFMPTNN